MVCLAFFEVMRKRFIKSLLAFLDELEISYQTCTKEPGSAISEIEINDSDHMIQLHYVGDDNNALNPQIYPRLKHLWEDQWLNQPEKIKSKIRSLVGLTAKVHGRQTTVVKLNNDELIGFLNDNHLNVPIKAKYKYGLTFKHDLVAIMSFSKGRPIQRDGMKYNSFELLRYCNKLNMTVVGGVSKLLKHFIKEQSPDDIMTYVDADWSDGKALETFGFELVGYKDPIRLYLNLTSGEREYEDFLREKLGLRGVPDPGELRAEFINAGYAPVRNSGSYKYILDLKSLSN